jgi:hypothetical protein
MPGEGQREELIRELKIVRKAGLHRLAERMDELPVLSQLAAATMGAGTADDIERMLRHVSRSYTEGAQGTAIGILLGLDLGRRGANPTVLRDVAAKRLGYYSVETFRKKPEHNAIAYFADVLLRYVSDTERLEVTNPNKVDHIMSLISELTVAEYNELMRRIRHWFSTLVQNP